MEDIFFYLTIAISGLGIGCLAALIYRLLTKKFQVNNIISALVVIIPILIMITFQSVQSESNLIELILRSVTFGFSFSISYGIMQRMEDESFLNMAFITAEIVGHIYKEYGIVLTSSDIAKLDLDDRMTGEEILTREGTSGASHNPQV